MKVLKFIAALLVAILVSAGFTTAPASAATGGEQDNCPVSVNGNGNLLTDAVADVLINDYVDGLVVSTGEIHVLCLSYPEQGFAGINPDGSVYYGSFSGPLETDSFTVGATDGDKYYTSTVTINLERTTFETPVVTQKLKTKHGKVLKKGWLKVSNTTLRGEQIMAGDFNQSQPDVTKYIAAGANKIVSTKRAHLDFILFTLNDDGYPVYVSAGHANMRTGVVKMEQDMSYRGSSAARMKASAPRWSTTR